MIVCFINKAQFNAGFADRLKLKDGAVLMIKDRGHALEPQAVPPQCSRHSYGLASTYVLTSQDLPSIKHMECQTDHKTVSVEVQAKPLMQSVGIQCSFAPSQKTAASTDRTCTKQRHAGFLHKCWY